MARRKKKKSVIRDYLFAIGGAIVLAFSIRFFLIEAYRMPSRAMMPAVEAGDTLFVSKIAYGLRIPFSSKRVKGGKTPEYGDVIVLEFAEEPGREYIKRVVGKPGDRVQLKNGHLILNGEDRSRPPENNQLCGTERLPPEKTYPICWEPPILEDTPEIQLGDGEYFVLGDLRSQGPEVRRLKLHGKVRMDGIRGKATKIWLSVNTPRNRGGGGDWFSRIRFDRLFKRIE